MLKPAAYPAEGFRADAQVRGDITQGAPALQYAGVFEEVFIAVGSCFEMGIHETFLEGGYNIFHTRSGPVFRFRGIGSAVHSAVLWRCPIIYPSSDWIFSTEGCPVMKL